jgi:hypothetical protein
VTKPELEGFGIEEYKDMSGGSCWIIEKLAEESSRLVQNSIYCI